MDGCPIFLGNMLQRNDSGAQDYPVWIAHDDRWLMSRFIVRGAFIYDSHYNSDPKASFMSRYTCHFNPNGMNNCVGIQTTSGLVPMFYPYAEATTATETIFAKLTKDDLTAWTPRRALQYLQFISMVNDAYDGYNTKRNGYRTFYASSRLQWTMKLDALDGSQGRGGDDPLDAKLQSIDISGKSLLESICQILHVAGTHDVGLDIKNDTSYIMLYPRYRNESSLVINVRRGGSVDEANIAVDFDLSEDASNIAESVLIEGQERKAELRLEFDPSLGSDYLDDPEDDFVNTISPAWTDQDELWFTKVIEGNETYAYLPASPGLIPSVLQDGTGGTYPVDARSKGAISLARQLYPDVFMTYQINVENLATTAKSPMHGINEEWKNETNYPINYDVRSLYNEQLNKLDSLDRIPVRCMILNWNGDNNPTEKIDKRTGSTTEAMWIESPYLNGLMINPRKFRLVGLTENLDSGDTTQVNCSYLGSLYVDPLNVRRRGIRLNIAIPLDHRIEGYSELSTEEVSELDPTMTDQLGGKLIAYEQNDAFVHEYNMDSFPQPNTTGNVKIPDKNIQFDEQNINAAAARMLQRQRNPEKRSNWIFPGIRRDYQPGKFVSKVKVIGGLGTDIDYKIESIIPSVVYDFLRQITRVGGIHSYTPSPESVPDITTKSTEPATPEKQSTTTGKPLPEYDRDE